MDRFGLRNHEREGLFRLHDGWNAQAKIQLLMHGEALVRAAESLPGHAHLAYAVARMDPGSRAEFSPFSPKALSTTGGLFDSRLIRQPSCA